MGRQAHLARLALGRSPFDPPLQDENGDLIQGPNVQHDTARNYVQQFDARGHPQNLASEASRRRLRRAQNEVLSTVGVVVRKARAERSTWQSMSEEQKHLLLLDENIAGANFGIVESVVEKLSTRWLSTLRRRILTYKSYVGLPLPQILMKEWRMMGLWPILFAGLPSGAIVAVSQALRDDTLDDGRSANIPRSIGTSFVTRATRVIGTHSLRLLWFTVEYPFYAFSVLQSLYLLPIDAVPHPWTLVPFNARSLIQLPQPLPDRALPSLFFYATSLFTHPFTIAYIRDQMGKVLYTRIYVLVRHLVVKPDRPDRISLQSARANSSVFNDTTIPGLSTDAKLKRSQTEPSTLSDTVKALFPALFWVWERILQRQSASLAVELTPDMEEELIQRSIMYYRDFIRRDRRDEGDPRHALRTLRIMAIRAAFADFGLDPDQAMVDIFEMAEGMDFPERDDASTATPEPEEELLNAPISTDARHETDNQEQSAVEAAEPPPPGDAGPVEDRPSEEPLEIIGTDASGLILSGNPNHTEPLAQPAIALETLLDPIWLETDDDAWDRAATPAAGVPLPSSPRPISPTGSPPSPPEPGITRAPSLATTGPRPVRRETDIYDERTRPSRQDLFYRHHSSRDLRDEDDTVYRVTILSNHPAEAFALNVAAIVEPILLIPLDILFLRSLAHNFVTQQSTYVVAASAGSLLTNVFPPGLSFRAGGDLSRSASLQALGNWTITLAIQSMINFLLWKTSTHFVLRLGRRFGWGKV
ncbi:hypothetical protein LTR20_007306 [Exophiala xenobiotica]|nr:hypothetical protein LTS13_006464 [Exophiala xenobiotica]KAK5401168.1 hypothetical protein LTR79_001687 [Exophiala xenobiotica]KAK5409095.1 hypothetical protein LTR90_009218 [Exophiala xenobiotica]KAK5459999.1 hypothetical protein LTR20_007306 [Exophiala xenobiotica]KAK5488937.1 hypothetical protein LTR26_004253 [Exophiala xenobiotica]